MNKVVLDAALRSALGDLKNQVEVFDEAGDKVGYFVPLDRYRELIVAWSQREVSDEDLERRSKEPGGRTLQEIWARLNAG